MDGQRVPLSYLDDAWTEAQKITVTLVNVLTQYQKCILLVNQTSLSLNSLAQTLSCNKMTFIKAETLNLVLGTMTAQLLEIELPKSQTVRTFHM